MTKTSKCSSASERALLAALLALAAPRAAAGTLFPAGTESKAAGNESSLLADGAPAALYNPANLAARSQKANHPYAELGFVNVNYTYEHPDFDPVTVSVNSPTASFGYTRQVLPGLVLGGVLFPSKTGKTAIPALPRKTGNGVTPVAATSEDEVLDLALGAGYQLSRVAAVGLSADVTQESHALTAHLIGNGNDLIATKYRNTFARPVFGTRLTPLPQASALAATLAVKPAQIKAYKGSQTSATAPARRAPRAADYEPLSAAAGVRGEFRHASAGFEVRHLAWARGAGVVKSATYDDEPRADLKDVNEYNFTAGYELPHALAASAGVAIQPTPWGRGKDDGQLADHVYGADYGRLDAMDRRTYALGLKGTFRGVDLSVALSRTHGERTLTGDADNVGFYRLDVTAVSGGLNANF